MEMTFPDLGTLESEKWLDNEHNIVKIYNCTIVLINFQHIVACQAHPALVKMGPVFAPSLYFQ